MCAFLNRPQLDKDAFELYSVHAYLTAFKPMTASQSLGRRDRSGQSNSSCATGTTFFFNFMASAYSFRTKSVASLTCWKKDSVSYMPFCCTLICGIIFVEKSVHAPFCPHQNDVFRSMHGFPKLLVECSLRTKHQCQHQPAHMDSRLYLTKVVHIQKDIQSHRFETNFEELGEVGSSFSSIRNENVASRLICVLYQC